MAFRISTFVSRCIAISLLLAGAGCGQGSITFSDVSDGSYPGACREDSVSRFRTTDGGCHDTRTQTVWSAAVPADYAMNYVDATTYCNDLVVAAHDSDPVLGDFDDWQLPTVDAFVGLAEGEGFKIIRGLLADVYWTQSSNNMFAMGAIAQSGESFMFKKTEEHLVICARSGKPRELPRHFAIGNGMNHDGMLTGGPGKAISEARKEISDQASDYCHRSGYQSFSYVGSPSCNTRKESYLSGTSISYMYHATCTAYYRCKDRLR